MSFALGIRTRVPARGATLDQPVRLEPAQRVGDRQHAHPEFLGQTTARERGAGPQLAAEDLLANRDIGGVGQARRRRPARAIRDRRLSPSGGAPPSAPLPPAAPPEFRPSIASVTRNTLTVCRGACY